MRAPRTVKELGLGGHDRRHLSVALARVPGSRAYRRVLAVLSVARGRTAAEVADLLKVSRRAVQRWVLRYLSGHRVEDLFESPRSGRPRVAQRVSNAVIAREFKRDPLRLGHKATAWTVELLAGHLSRRAGCAISARTLRRRMRAMGLRRERPRNV